MNSRAKSWKVAETTAVNYLNIDSLDQLVAFKGVINKLHKTIE